MKIKSFFFLSFLLLTASCGSPKAQAPRKNVQPVMLRTFPKQDWRFANVRLFLWHENMTPQDVSEALRIGMRLDQLDTEAFPINRRRLELDEKIQPLKEEIKAMGAESRRLKKQLDKMKASKKTTDEMPLGADAFDDGFAKLEKEWKDLQDSIATKKAALEPLDTEFGEVETKQYEIQGKGQPLVEKLMTVVDYYKDQPTSIAFQFEPEGRISASISNWNMGDDLGPRNYSTEAAEGQKPTIGNVVYNEQGGVFEFDVFVFTDEAQQDLRETFHFKIARTKYSPETSLAAFDPNDSRAFFSGELTRTSANGEVRRGVAKIVDRNN